MEGNNVLMSELLRGRVVSQRRKMWCFMSWESQQRFHVWCLHSVSSSSHLYYQMGTRWWCLVMWNKVRTTTNCLNKDEIRLVTLKSLEWHLSSPRDGTKISLEWWTFLKFSRNNDMRTSTLPLYALHANTGHCFFPREVRRENKLCIFLFLHLRRVPGVARDKLLSFTPWDESGRLYPTQ